jgi:hypothetical protein
MYSDMELGKTTMTEASGYFDEDGQLFPGSDDIEISKLEIDDVKTQRYYGTIGYGLTNSWEAYIQLGIADLKGKFRDAYDPEDEWSGLNFDNDFAWGWGTRYTFHEQDNYRCGVSVQMNWLDTSWDVKSSGSEDLPGLGVLDKQEKTTIDWETYDLLIAVGATVDMGGWNLYGGPFYYMIDGDLDVETAATFPGAPITVTKAVTDSGDLEADSIGVFVGAQCTLMEKACLTTEISFTGEGYAIGAGVAVGF